MPCGCNAACGCEIVAGAGIAVQRLGDSFVIVNTAPAAGGIPTFVQQAPPVVAGPYVWYELDNLGALVTVWVEDGL